MHVQQIDLDLMNSDDVTLGAHYTSDETMIKIVTIIFTFATPGQP